MALLSINSYDELTGGGVYLRTLILFLKKQKVTLTLLDKKIDSELNPLSFKRLSYRKNGLNDIVSRVFLLPSFYMVHLFSILVECSKNDIIGLHNSRLGIFVPLLKILFPNKKIVVFSDNFEFNLVCQKEKSTTGYIEIALVWLNEKIAYKFADGISYITEEDKINTQKFYHLKNKKTCIVPVVIENKNKNVINNIQVRDSIVKLKEVSRKKFVFTASFDFFPNIDAAIHIYSAAAKNQDIDFILAGRKVSNLKFQKLNNLILLEDLSPLEMDVLLSSCDVFYSPITLGSGMKTKIAEALSQGLHVYATPLTMIGYDEVIKDSECVSIMSSPGEEIKMQLKHTCFSKKSIICKQQKFYSPQRFNGNELMLLLNSKK